MDREKAEEIMDAVESNIPWHLRIPAHLVETCGSTPAERSKYNCQKCKTKDFCVYSSGDGAGSSMRHGTLEASGLLVKMSAGGGQGPKEENKTMTRSCLGNFIAEKCEGIKKLFDYKNQDYGADGDAFANFRKTAQRIVVPFMQKHGIEISEVDAMFLVLLIYQDKHLVALSQTGLQGNEVDERLGDIANYALIARGMLIQSKGGVV